MLIKLYTVSDAPNVINKTLGASFDIEVTLRKDFNIINPELILMLTHAQAMSFNYVHMPDLSRLYFIDRVESVNSKLYRFILSCDVLETYKANIFFANCLFNKQAEIGDLGEVDAAETGLLEINSYESNIELEANNTIILSSIGNE